MKNPFQEWLKLLITIDTIVRVDLCCSNCQLWQKFVFVLPAAGYSRVQVFALPFREIKTKADAWPWDTNFEEINKIFTHVKRGHYQNFLSAQTKLHFRVNKLKRRISCEVNFVVLRCPSSLSLCLILLKRDTATTTTRTA